MTTIRDFIYVDVERMKSLYSQVFEGFVDRVVQAEASEESSSDLQKGAILSGSSIEAKVAVASYRTESRFLYDHMYTMLENELNNAILVPNDISPENYVESLLQFPFVKVTGKAEIADYRRINTFLNKFNELGEALTYISNFESFSGIEDLVAEFRKKIKQAKDRNEKAKLKRKLESIENQIDLAALAKENNLYLDSKFLEYLSEITTMFFEEDRLEITISPNPSEGQVVFRGLLDKQWLRISAEYIRSLYAGYPASNLTMVGQYTYYPSIIDESGKEANEEPTNGPEDSSLRDAYRNFFSAYKEVEKTFTNSARFIEIIVWPLAIYRETEIN